MAISTLVIGLGGTGVLTLRALKTLYCELPESERVPAAFLAFDFDRSAVEGGSTFTAGGETHSLADLSDLEFYYLDSLGIQDLLRNLDRAEGDRLAWSKILDWFPERTHVQVPVSEVESNGASQLRVLGRLGFFLNDELIEGAVRRALDQCPAEVSHGSLSEKKRVILVSSLAGGTGAGMLIDMAYIARRQEGRPRVYAYLLLPEVFEDVDNGGRIFQNAYACLKELSYLKDQMIPFHAEYYRIPPVDVRVRGEEPFARIFLARGTGFSGSDAIRDATAMMAASILPQLQRTIQQKTLAIVSNTLSPNADGEQRQLRTHVFSAASSHFVRLEKTRSIADMVFEVLAQHLSDPDFLAKVHERDVQIAMARAQDPGAEAPGGTEAQRANAERLLKRWQSEIESAARDAAVHTQAELNERMETLRQMAVSNRTGDLEKAIDELKKLQPVAFMNFRREEYLSNVKALRSSGSFAEFEKSVKNPAGGHLQTLDIAMGDDPLKLEALYQGLKRQFRGWVDFPTDDELIDLGGPGAGPAAGEQAATGRMPAGPRQRLSDQTVRLGTVAAPRWWQRLRWAQNKRLHDASQVHVSCQALGEALGDPRLVDNLQNLFKVRAFVELRDRINERLKYTESKVAWATRVWRDLPPAAVAAPDVTRLTRGDEIVAMLRRNLARLVAEASQAVRPEEPPEVRRTKLFGLVNRMVEETPGLRGQQFRIEGGADSVEDGVRGELVRSRQKVFERRTPNPQRKGYSLVMIPRGIQWPNRTGVAPCGAAVDGAAALRSFLTASTAQILSTRVQCEEYAGSRLWIYSEDLFNPPEHICNLYEYYRRYNSQRYKELFHIDRRMLNEEAFRDIVRETSSIVVRCGNSGCNHNISSTPRSQTLCPHCHRPIRTRCGNEGCFANDLDKPENRAAKQCPSCSGYNHAGWWRCCRHGKVAADVPIDKARCPRCIEEYQRDSAAWPLDEVSVRPDLADQVECPHCVDLHLRDRAHEVFTIPPELLGFYRNGVNGHDLRTFENVSQDLRLPGKVRCPQCRTLLIPIDHDARLEPCRTGSYH